jgi:lysophospholipase L1-like esterase
MTATQQQAWYRRHPRLALLTANLALFALLALAAELFLRIYIPYSPGYYTGVRTSASEFNYPYGRIPINADGFPDEAFDPNKTRRVGYFGDSVTYGVGAGYGYRISELLEAAYPDRDHLNLGGIGLSISSGEIAYCLKLARRYGLQQAVYLFNLNDIVPDQVASGAERTAVRNVQDSVIARLDWLRGRSYLYTYLRTLAKSLLESHGVGFHGSRAYELFPQESRNVVEQTAKRINAFHTALAEAGVELSVVILPYEMQISAPAEHKYRELGVQWEDGFIERSAQKILLESLAPEVPVADAYYAFVDPADPTGSRSRNELGEYFVYNQGDKLDWNHPNRAGHRAIAEFMAKQAVLGPPSAPIASPE